MGWKNKINKNYTQISIYVIATVVIIYTLSLLVKNAPSIMQSCLVGVSWIFKIIKPVILGFVFAYLMEPVISFFERRFLNLKTKKYFKKIVRPRTWATLVSVVLLMLGVSALVSVLVFTVTDQLRLVSLDDIVQLGQGLVASVQDFSAMILSKMNELNIQSGELEQYIKNASTFLTNSLVNFAKGSVNSLSNISSTMTTLIFGFIIGIYFMIDGRMFRNYMNKISKALLSERANQGLHNSMKDLDGVFSGYIRGQLLDAMTMMVLISITLSVIGVKFGVLIGILAGIGNLIPYFGPIIAYIGTTLVCLFNGDIKTWIIAMIALFIIQFIDGNLIGPKLLSNSIQIHPLIVIVSLIFGSALAGFFGMLLAVPVGAYLKLVFSRFIDRRLTKKEEMLRKEELPKREEIVRKEVTVRKEEMIRNGKKQG